MLEANRGQIVPRSERVGFAPKESPPSSDGIATAVGFARRQIWTIVFFALLGTVLGAVLLFRLVPNYSAAATLLVDTRKINISQQPAVFAQMSLESSSAMDSQLEILKSENIALAVVDQLKLWDDPEFVDTRRGLKAKLFGNFFGPPWIPNHAERVQMARDALAKRLTVNRIGISYAIEIGFESKSAERAAEVANGVADAYIEEQLSSQYYGTKQASDWLKTHVDELRDQSEAAQRAVVEYKKRNNIVETSTGQLADDQHIVELNSQLSVARGQVSEAKAIFDQLDAATLPNASDAIMNAPIGNAAESDTVNKLRAKYLELAYREGEWSAKYGHDHLAVVSLRNQMQQIRTEILGELKHVKELRRGEYTIAQQREAAILGELDTAKLQSQKVNQASVELKQLQTSARTLQDAYNSILNRYQAAVQEQTSPVAEASVITRARAPGARNYKKTFVIAGLFPIAGLAFGVGIALLRELSSRVFWTSKPIESTLRIPCIGILPKLKYSAKKISSGQLQASVSGGPKSLSRGDRSICWNVVDEAFSRFSEGIRSIKVAVDLDNKTRSNKIIGFTSTLPAEGKSTVATAFGLIVARTGARVIVVDCDLRNPSLTRSIAPGATSGILELIAGSASLEDVVWSDRSTRMDFLPAVVRSEHADSYSILASDRMKTVFEELRARYEFVVVDLSPLVLVVDALATASYVDSYVYVVEWGRT